MYMRDGVFLIWERGLKNAYRIAVTKRLPHIFFATAEKKKKPYWLPLLIYTYVECPHASRLSRVCGVGRRFRRQQSPSIYRSNARTYDAEKKM